MTDETIFVVPLHCILRGDYKTIPNLLWLLPMALHTGDGGYLRYKSCDTNTK